MSLKALHIVFITLSTALAVFFGLWARCQGSAGFSNASFALAAVFVLYGVWFLNKIKNLS